MTCGLYTITHKASGVQYVGRSVDIEQRWHEHRHDTKKGRTNARLHNALRKHGVEAFEFKVLLTAPARLHAHLEECFILSLRTQSPKGYNVGGTYGGFPSKALMTAMEDEERVRWEQTMARVGKLGTDALQTLRLDPVYEASFLKIKSDACRKREANIRAKRVLDPVYDAGIREKRSRATTNRVEGYQHKGVVFFKERMASDPEFAAQVRANRQRAAAASHAAKRRGKDA